MLSLQSRAPARGRAHDAPRRLIVIGTGVIGLATAYAFARRGWSVTVVDQAEGPALGASFANGAQLSYAYTDALAHPDLLRRLPQLTIGLDPSFKVRGLLDPHFAPWALQFLRNCTWTRFSDHTVAGLHLALESSAALESLMERHPFEFHHAVPGKLHIFRSRPAFETARWVVDIKRRHGGRQAVLSWGEAVAIEPALRAAGEVVGVIHTPDDAVGDPFRFCTELLKVLTQQYGVTARFGFRVVRLEAQEGRAWVANAAGDVLRADLLAICAGVDAPQLLRKLGLSAPVWPMKGYSFTAAVGPEAPRLSVTDSARKVVFCRLADQIRVAGLAELGAQSTAVDRRRAAQLIDLARSVLPAAAHYDAVTSVWAGLRPMSPSSLPIINRPRPELVLNVGHGMLGWTYAMGAGERAAALSASSRLERIP